MSELASEPSAQERVVPYPDRDSAPWWEALARHELVQQRCDDCGRWRWPARAICGECGSFGWSWQPIAGTGTVIGHTRTHHAFLPGFEAPYWNVLVALDEQDDLTLIGTWHGDGDPAIGMPVRAWFDDLTDGVTLLRWTAVSG